MRLLTRAIYLVFGTLAIGLGALVLVEPSLALPRDEFSALGAHLVRELGAQGVFIGLMALWCLFHHEQRRPVHAALVLFTALFAAIHWWEYVLERRQVMSPLLNSVPFVLFAATLPARHVPPAS